MKSINRLIVAVFRQPSLDELRARQLDSMQRELLEVQAQKEYYTAMEVALATGIERLQQN